MTKIVQLTIYLQEQFPATVGNIRLGEMLVEIESELSQLNALRHALHEVENTCHNALQKDGTARSTTD